MIAVVAVVAVIAVIALSAVGVVIAIIVSNAVIVVIAVIVAGAAGAVIAVSVVIYLRLNRFRRQSLLTYTRRFLRQYLNRGHWICLNGTPAVLQIAELVGLCI